METTTAKALKERDTTERAQFVVHLTDDTVGIDGRVSYCGLVLFYSLQLSINANHSTLLHAVSYH